MRQATGYTAHPAYFSAKALHLLKGADSYRTINEKLDELRLAVSKACRCLEDEGQLSNAALAPLLKAAVANLAGRPRRASPARAACFRRARAGPPAYAGRTGRLAGRQW